MDRGALGQGGMVHGVAKGQIQLSDLQFLFSLYNQISTTITILQVYSSMALSTVTLFSWTWLILLGSCVPTDYPCLLACPSLGPSSPPAKFHSQNPEQVCIHLWEMTWPVCAQHLPVILGLEFGAPAQEPKSFRGFLWMCLNSWVKCPHLQKKKHSLCFQKSPNLFPCFKKWGNLGLGLNEMVQPLLPALTWENAPFGQEQVCLLSQAPV